MPARSYAHGASPVALLGETIPENLRRTVERSSSKPALIVRSQGKRFTWGELLDQVRLAARGLIARGVAKGDRVGIWAPNRYEWVVMQYATAQIGAILVNVNPAYKTTELEYVLQQSGTSLLVYARAFRASDFHGMVQEVRGRCPQLRETLQLEDGWDRLLADASKVGEPQLLQREASLDPDDAINIQYTSGTTGFPKGATLSHDNILNNGYFIGEALRYSDRDRVCIPVPFYHCFGMVLANLACTTHGACMVVPGEAFDPLAVLETVQAERCTALYGVPTMFIAVLDHPRFKEFDVTSLRTGNMAGSPCPVEVMKRVMELMHMSEVGICYGMTETSPVSTQSAVDDPIEKRVAT
ncbi:MAG TPA: AMP-binding protein, partial [Myxococcales bacterium]